ncbi:site-specific integrase [Vibrio neonatus]|uniref:site-specific integrase n=1 Tax=Vibrio neonatus TaxID=278860 RepID=UPI0021C2D9A5|nr:site-specific integrase [Vibrio neonatus]
MYLYKSRHCVYFVRVCTPKALVQQGYPFDFKFSLKTKSRPIAIRRSAPIISQILKSLDNVDISRDSPKETKQAILSSVDSLRNSFNDSGVDLHSVSSQADTKQQTVKSIKRNFAQGYRWQEDFITSKQKARITHLTVHQLNKRTLYFLDYFKNKKIGITQITASDLMEFGNNLQSWDKSAKTKKDFWGAAKQFLKWLTLKQHLPRNPFEGLTVTFKSEKFASEQREKWSSKQIKNLLSCSQFKQASPSMQWTVLLLIYMGLRPTEACQISVRDISIESGMFVLSITDDGQLQKLKNHHSLRKIPIHKTLLQSGFIDFVRQQKKAAKSQLFDWTPTGKDKDWTKLFRIQFGKIQSSIEMQPKQRPTAYGFRHTFIDCLKQQGIEEYQVAEVVGHANQNMTFGRYGKKLSMSKLKAVIDVFSIGD